MGSSNGITGTSYYSSGYYPFGYYRGRYGWVSESDFFSYDTEFQNNDEIYLTFRQFNSSSYPIHIRHVKLVAIKHDDIVTQSSGSMN